MNDLDERLRGIDRLTPPDLLEVARLKAQAVDVAPPARARRFATIAASMAIGMLGVIAVAIAFRSSPSTAPAIGEWRHGEIESLGASFEFPPTWHVQHVDEFVGTTGLTGAVVSNVGQDLHHPDLGPNAWTSAWDLSELPSDGVVVSIEAVESFRQSEEPDSTFPVDLADANRLKPTRHSGSTEGWWLEFTLNSKLMGVRVYFGPDATGEDRRIAEEVVASIRPTEPKSPPEGAQPESVRVRVPNLEGLPLDEATTLLASLGLDVAPVYLANDSDLPGVITELEPKPGTRVEGETSVIVYVSAGPDGGGFAWAGSIVTENPGVFVGSYRGSDSFPVLAVGPDADLVEWHAALDATSNGRRFDLVRCSVEPERLREVERELRALMDNGAVEGDSAFGVDARTCSVLLEGALSTESIHLLREQFGTLITIVDGMSAYDVL
jgi:hypothetical protein